MSHLMKSTAAYRLARLAIASSQPRIGRRMTKCCASHQVKGATANRLATRGSRSRTAIGLGSFSASDLLRGNPSGHRDGSCRGQRRAPLHTHRVARRWLAAVRRVLIDPRLQFLDLVLQFSEFLLVTLNQKKNRHLQLRRGRSPKCLWDTRRRYPMPVKIVIHSVKAIPGRERRRRLQRPMMPMASQDFATCDEIAVSSRFNSSVFKTIMYS